MNLPMRTSVAILTICLATALCGAWAWEYLDDQRSAAAAAATELAACRTLAKQITASRLAPAIAPRAADITAVIASAAAQADLAEGSLDHVDPGSDRRNPDGTVIPRQIELTIRQATLRQIITFAHTLSAPPGELRATRLRLTPSGADGGGWAAQMTLTYPLSPDLRE
jgi:uncharacterized membrane protein